MIKIIKGFVFCGFFVLAACSGGGDSSEAETPNTPPPVSAIPDIPFDPGPDSNDVCDISSAPSDRSFGSGGTRTVSGSVSLEINIATDSDNNDTASACSDNSAISNAQAINNLTTVNGYVSIRPTNVPGNRFQNETDELDLFQVSLQEGQIITLEVADFVPESPAQNDIDLFLLDMNADIIATSISITAFEQISISDSGNYTIAVRSYSGSSKYILKSSYSTNTAYLPDYNRDVVVEDLIPNEVILKYRLDAVDDIYGRSIATQKNPSGVVLEKFNETKNAFSLQVEPNESAFENELKNVNFDAYEKFQTLNKAKQLRQLPNVEFASLNFMRHLQRVPNDRFYGRQWHYEQINLPQAWNVTTGAPAAGDVVVAVVDSGVYLAHEDLSNKLVTGYDFISSTSNSLDGDGIDPNPDDPGDSTILGESSWHGTHVAGTIAAQSNNDIGVAGVSWDAKIMPLRVCGPEGCSTFDIYQAVSYAAGLPNNSNTVPTQTADIINLSLGGFGSSDFEAQFYQDLFDAGVIVVAAAGNETSSDLAFPASYPGVISVSALDAGAQLAPYSNFGTQIDIAAPGGNASVDLTGDGFSDGVASTVVDDSEGKDNRASSYAYYQGTSMASPHVAGVLALMKAVYPDLTAAEVDILLRDGALTNDIGDNGRDNLYGWGMIDAFKAVQAATDLSGGTLPAVISASPSALDLVNETSATLTIKNIGGGAPVLDLFSISETWLTIEAIATNSEGLGDYRITVDRTGLVEGFYSANINFDFIGASSLVVRVTMLVGNIEIEGESAQLYALLVNPDTFLIEYLSPVTGSSSNLRFSFDEVVDGPYLLAVSTDIDANRSYCSEGQFCGVYPSITDAELVNISSDLSGLSVPVGVISNLSTLSMTNGESFKTPEKSSSLEIRSP